jgi:hypothetical protein
MAIFEPSPIADRISKALGLENCRSLKFSMEAGSVVAVVTEQYVSGDQLGRLACELETNNWVLVSKKEYESNRQSLTTEEREAIEAASYAAKKFYEHATADTFRSLLQRLGGTNG